MQERIDVKVRSESIGMYVDPTGSLVEDIVWKIDATILRTKEVEFIKVDFLIKN